MQQDKSDMAQSLQCSFNELYIEKIKRVIAVSIENGLSGAALGLLCKGQVIFREDIGYQRQFNEGKPMSVKEPITSTTLFDLASLTKIFSTLLAYLILVDSKEVCVSDCVHKYLPAFSGGKKTDVTIKQLLQHTSGMPASYPFYNRTLASDGFYSQNRERTLEVLPYLPLQRDPDTSVVYSDINFMLLGQLLEKVTGMRQDYFVQDAIYKPFGLKHTCYLPLENGFNKNNCEASELCGNTRDGHVYFENIRTNTLQGEVQDEKTYYSMGGVAGHAGLFSSCNDLMKLANLLLHRGSYDGYTLCQEEVLMSFVQSYNLDKSYGLGFQFPTKQTQLIYGLLFPPIGQAVAHTGWTGKCFVLNFAEQAFAILLTNKKHSNVLPCNGNYDIFEGDLTPAGLYGSVMGLFSAGLINPN